MASRFRLFISSHNERSTRTADQLERIFASRLPQENYTLEVIDVAENPETALEENILITPTLIMDSGASTQRIIGELGHIEELLPEFA